MENNYAFLFLTGSCGCFLKGIFYYYLHTAIMKDTPIKLVVDETTGHCHDMFTGPHYHTFDEILEIKKQFPDVKVIAISVDPGDLSTVTKMGFHKLKNTDYMCVIW